MDDLDRLIAKSSAAGERSALTYPLGLSYTSPMQTIFGYGAYYRYATRRTGRAGRVVRR